MIDNDVHDFIAAVKIVEDAGWKVVSPKAAKLARYIQTESGSDGRFYIQSWNCDLSPIGKCIGDSETDEAECVFCREPEERK